MRLQNLKARQILDSRGNPTIEVDALLEDGSTGRAAVPSGASTGEREAIELRDGDKPYGGQGVLKAVNYVEDEILGVLKYLDCNDQAEIDKAMCDLDGTPNKFRLGANAILAVSLAIAKAVATSKRVPLYRYINVLAGMPDMRLPLPMMNLINGGAHAAGSTDIQEFMIVPVGAKDFPTALQMGSEIFHALGKLLKDKGYATTVGDEGGYAPAVGGNTEALDLLMSAIALAGYEPGKDIKLALDVAASELHEDGSYNLRVENRTLDTDGMINWYHDRAQRYPLVSIEDGLDQDDWTGWTKMTEGLAGSNLTLVGDDLLVTQVQYLERAIKEHAGNAILVKLNQVGTLTETIAATKMAMEHGWRAIISHRSGETEDTSIAHLAVGLGTGLIKTGSLSRSERIAKYNELLRINEELSTSKYWLGGEIFS